VGAPVIGVHGGTLDEAPAAYATFQAKADGMIRAVVNPV
jgi:hypothetical protein